jgi:hypothetical protein
MGPFVFEVQPVLSGEALPYNKIHGCVPLAPFVFEVRPVISGFFYPTIRKIWCSGPLAHVFGNESRGAKMRYVNIFLAMCLVCTKNIMNK